MINRNISRNSGSLLIVLLVFCVALSSCEPLRKKFTRQKKKSQVEDTSFIPVLEPEEYPDPENNPKMNYENHYALVKVFYRDMWTSLEANDSVKSQRYNIKWVRDHIIEMQRLVNPDKKARLQMLSDMLNYYDKSLDEPLAMRNKSRIQSDLRSFDRMLRGQLRSDRIAGDFIAAKE